MYSKFPFLFFYLFFLFYYFIFLAVLGLHCCAWAFCSCVEQASHCSGFSCCRAQALGAWASLVVACGLSSCGSRALVALVCRRTGLVALRHMGSSRTRAQTRVPYIGKWILNHCTTREAPKLPFLTFCFSIKNILF